MGGRGSGRKTKLKLAEPEDVAEAEAEEAEEEEEEKEEQPLAITATRSPEQEKKSISQNVMAALGLGKKAVVQPVAKVTRKPTTRKRGSKDVSADFVAALVPTVALGVAVYVRMRIRDPRYKGVAPQVDEISKVLTPLTRILARRIEVAGKMSEDTLDLAISLAMTGVMASRMYGDYLTISGEGKDEQPATRNNGHANGYRQQPLASDFAGSAGSFGATGGNGSSPGQAVNSSPRSPLHADGWQQLDGKQADAIISRALEEDARYRATNGLL